MEIKVQDYAAARGVSPEAIRKKLRRNPPELEGHVVRRNNSTWLDDIAQAYLDEGMERNFAEISDGSMQRKIDQLQAKNDELRDRLDLARDRYELVQEQLQAATQLQLETQKQQLVLEAAAADRERQIQKAAADLQAEQEERLKAEQEKRTVEKRLEDEIAARKRAEERAEALAKRGLLARILNKEV